MSKIKRWLDPAASKTEMRALELSQRGGVAGQRRLDVLRPCKTDATHPTRSRHERIAQFHTKRLSAGSLNAADYDQGENEPKNEEISSPHGCLPATRETGYIVLYLYVPSDRYIPHDRTVRLRRVYRHMRTIRNAKHAALSLYWLKQFSRPQILHNLQSLTRPKKWTMDLHDAQQDSDPSPAGCALHAST